MKQVGQVISGEKGILVTVCCFINVIENTASPFMIFPKVNFNPHMLNRSPAGTADAATKSGIWPLNRNTFCDDDFLSSYVSDRNERDVNHENQTVESVNNCTVQKLGEKAPQPSNSKESFGFNEADPPSVNLKELTDWEIRERTPEVSSSKGNCHNDSMDPEDFTVENGDFPTEHVSEVGQFVVVWEGAGRNKMQMYSVGEITDF
ncbi:hypothetical protein ILUMI_04033 [Ignelater luminosus]|uniref:Uncharacterized protein n=1 Tax=Ignelater luminosus TaxID=2038154 RepID=A0A8K0GLK9_IGNLU|nr:hypothetical protein ILUMI_04033 [Ignelater luminosus]